MTPLNPIVQLLFVDGWLFFSQGFIHNIYKNCPSIEYLSLAFSSSKKHFTEFEKLLKVCQNLKSLLLVILNSNIDEVKTDEEIGEDKAR